MKTAEEMRMMAKSKKDEYSDMEHDRALREIENKIETAAALGSTSTHVTMSSYYMDIVSDDLKMAGYWVDKVSAYVWRISW